MADELVVMLNEETGMWEQKPEPFAVVEYQTEEDFEHLKMVLEFHKKHRWVSVKDRLPDISAENNQAKVTERVIAWDGTGCLFGCFKIWTYDGSYVFIGVSDDDMDIAAYDTVTHWMPLPEPPKGE